MKKLIAFFVLCGCILPLHCMKKKYKKESPDLVKKIQNVDKSLKGEEIVVLTDKPLRGDKNGKLYMPGMGSGDIFQCLGNLKALKNRGAKTIVYDVKDFLKPIIKDYTEFDVDATKLESPKYVQLSTLYDINDGYVKEFNCTKPLITPDKKRVVQWKKLVKKYSGKNMPVLLFWGCAKNHRTDRALKKNNICTIVKDPKNIQFFDTEFRSPYEYKKPDVKGVIKPSDIYKDFDKKSFCDTLHLLNAVYELGGKAVSTETGTLHLAGRVAEGAHEDVVYGLGPVNPNERYYECYYTKEKDKYPAKKSKSILYPKSLILFWQDKKNDWSSVVKKVRQRLEKDAKGYGYPWPLSSLFRYLS